VTDTRPFQWRFAQFEAEFPLEAQWCDHCGASFVGGPIYEDFTALVQEVLTPHVVGERDANGRHTRKGEEEFQASFEADPVLKLALNTAMSKVEILSILKQNGIA
jgi:hypothetical protein